MADTIGKIRSRFAGDKELLGLAQWVGRKIRNHDPMSERDNLAARGKHLHRTKHRSMKDGKPEEGKVWVGMVNKETAPAVYYGLEDGRIFKITVEETFPDPQMLKNVVTAVGA